MARALDDPDAGPRDPVQYAETKEVDADGDNGRQEGQDDPRGDEGPEQLASDGPDASAGGRADSEKTGGGGGGERTTVGSFLKAVWEWIRPHYILDHLDRKSLKTVSRTWVMMWVSMVVLLIPRSQIWLGQASFLMVILAAINPVGSNSIAQSLMINALVCLISCSAWVFPIVSSAIAIKVRKTHWTQETVVKDLVARGLCKLDPQSLPLCVSLTQFRGEYFDARANVVIAFGQATCYFYMYLLRYRGGPIMKMVFPLAMIVASITGTYTAAIPYFDPALLGNLVWRPMGMSLSFNVLLSAIMFPHTSSYSFFDKGVGQIKSIKALAALQLDVLHNCRPSQDNFTRFRKIRQMALGINARLPLMGMEIVPARFEISIGRFDGGDGGEFMSALKGLVGSLSGFELFYDAVQERKEYATNGFHPITSGGHSLRRLSTIGAHASSRQKLFTALHQQYLPVANHETKMRINALQDAFTQGKMDDISLKDLDQVLDIIEHAFGDYLGLCTDALDCLATWLDDANNFRTYDWLLRFRSHKKRQLADKNRDILIDMRARLVAGIQKVKENKWKEVNREGFGKKRIALSVIGQGSLFSFLSEEFTASLLRLLDIFLSIDEVRPTPQIITYFTPTARKRASLSLEKIDANDELEPEYVDYADAPWKPTSHAQARNPDASPPRRYYHLIGKRFVRFLEIVLHDQVYNSIKFSFFLTMTTLPVFFKSTIFWYYRYRLIWVTIMTAFSMGDYTADTIYGFITKIVYTCVAVLAGLVCWYISTGSGRGNPYGLGAVSFVTFWFLAFYRLYSVHLSPAVSIILCASFMLVLGTSWQDSRPWSFISVGWGFEVAWVRLVSVIVGLAVAFIASVLPRPKTAKRAIRVGLSRLIKEIGNLHSDISKFAHGRIEDPTIVIADRGDYFLNKTSLISIKLGKIQSVMTFLRYEPPLQGVWPKEKYERLLRIMSDLTDMYRYMYRLINRLQDPAVWINRIATRAGWNDLALNADFFAVLYMTSGALQTERPLPKISPAYTTAQHYEILRNLWTKKHKDWVKVPDDGNDKDIKTTIDKSIEVAADDSSSRLDVLEGLDLGVIFSHDAELGTVTLILAHEIYERTDELMVLVKGLVGEEYDADEYFIDRIDSERESLMGDAA